MKYLYVHKFQIVHDIHESLNWNSIYYPEIWLLDILLLIDLNHTNWHSNQDF